MKAVIQNIEVNVDERHLNDWNLLKMLRKIDSGDSGPIVDVAEMLLGEEEIEKLEKHFEKDGIVQADKMLSFISDLLGSLNELKNSLPSPA